MDEFRVRQATDADVGIVRAIAFGATHRACAVVLMFVAAACGGGSPTAPATTTPTTLSLSGKVTDGTTAAGLSGATVSIADGPNAGKTTTTDGSGNYALAGLQQSSFTVNAAASDYVAQSKSVNLTSSQTLSFQLARAPTPPGFSGVRYDNIQIAHQFIVGSPIPTQNQASTYCCWPIPVRNPGGYTFDLSGVPLNVLPSGGTSNVISDSEMVIVGLNVDPAAGPMTFQWHKAVHDDTVVYAATGLPSWVWMYTFIGHFSWEISEPGSYYVVVDTPWGSARLDFLVISSVLTEHRIENDGVLFASRETLNANMRRIIGHGGGSGGGSGGGGRVPGMPFSIWRR